MGGSLPTVFNAANEYAVTQFMNHWIPYLSITDMIETAMSCHRTIADPTLEQILETERETYDLLQSRF